MPKTETETVIDTTGNGYAGFYSKDMTEASGTTAITGVGFTPTSITFLASYAEGAGGHSCGTSDDSGQDGAWLSYGITPTYSHSATVYSILLTADGSSYQYGNVSSYDSDGFTINWAKGGSPTATGQVWYNAIK